MYTNNDKLLCKSCGNLINHLNDRFVDVTKQQSMMQARCLCKDCFLAQFSFEARAVLESQLAALHAEHFTLFEAWGAVTLEYANALCNYEQVQQNSWALLALPNADCIAIENGLLKAQLQVRGALMKCEAAQERVDEMISKYTAFNFAARAMQNADAAL